MHLFLSSGRVWIRTYILLDDMTEKLENLAYPKILLGRENTSALFHEIINKQAKAHPTQSHHRQKRSTTAHVTHIRDSLGVRPHNWWRDTGGGEATIGALCFIGITLCVLLFVLVFDAVYLKPHEQ